MSNHLSPSEIHELLGKSKQRIPCGSCRSHYKDPASLYRIESLVLDTQTQQPMVIYTDTKSRISFSRLAQNFLSTVKHNQEIIPRFTIKSQDESSMIAESD